MVNGPQIDAVKAPNEENSRKAKFLAHSAWVCFNQGNHAEAEELLKQAIDLREAMHGPAHRKLIPLLNSLGIVLRESGQLSEATSVFERGLSICVLLASPSKMREIELLDNLLLCHQISKDEKQQAETAQRLLAAQAKERSLPASFKLKRHLTHSFSMSMLRVDDWAQEDSEQQVEHPLLVPVLSVMAVAAIALFLLLYFLLRH